LLALGEKIHNFDQGLSQMRDAFIPLAVCIGGFAAIYGLGKWILGPIDRAAKALRAPVRFAVSDFLCLFVAVQLPLTLVARLQDEDTEGLYWTFTVLAWIVAAAIWVSCAVAISRAGITSGWHRLIFMGLVLPIVYYGLIPFALMPVIAFGALWNGNPDEILGSPWLILVWLFMGVALFGCGVYTHRLVRSAKAGAAARANDADQSVDQTGASAPLAGSSSTSGHSSHLGNERLQ
jgi:hypothetical protein